jgi:hypothetical protein
VVESQPSKLSRFAGVTLSVVEGGSPQAKSRDAVRDLGWLVSGGSNSVVESQPSKLLVAGSIPVSRSRVEPFAGVGVAGARRRNPERK